MKLLYILLFFSILSFSQKKEAKLTLNDGTLFEGYGALTKLNRIKFKMNLTDEADKWGPNEVYQLEIIGYPNSSIYRYVQKKNGSYLLLKVIEDGTLVLYAREKFQIEAESYDEQERITGKWKKVRVISDFYLQRKDIGLFEKVRKGYSMKNFVAGCSAIKGDFKLLNNNLNKFQDLIWQFNNDCGEMEKIKD